MATPSILVKLAKPLAGNKRLYGLVTVALLLILGLGAGYYYYIKANQQTFKAYNLQELDFYYEKASRKFENDVLRFKARNSADDLQYEDFLDALSRLDETLRMEEQFDEYIINQKVRYASDSITLPLQSSILGSVSLNTDTLFQQSAFKSGTIRPVRLNEIQYQLFARKYLFTSSLDRDLSVELTLVGMISGSKYAGATRELSPWLIALLLVFLLLCLIGLPFFKLLFITPDERIYGRDAILAGICMILGAPILVASMLGFIRYATDVLLVIPDQLESMNASVNSRFTAENKQLAQDLFNWDLAAYDADPEACDEMPCSCSSVSFIELKDPSHIAQNFKFISKIDQNGDVCYHIPFVQAPPDDVAPKSLKNRSYFVDFMSEENIWAMEDSFRYVMRPVVSIEDETEEAVYVVRTEDGAGYKVGSVQLKSVHDPIMPFGYDFAIIDGQGEVWFHSQPGRATQENFFASTSRNLALKAALESRISIGGTTTYRGSPMMYHISPIEGTNLSAVTVYNRRLIGLEISEILTITSLSLLVAAILLGLVVVLSVFARSPSWGLYNFRSFIFDFLTPKDANRGTYGVLSFGFLALLVICLLIGPQTNSTPSATFISCLLLTVWTYVIVYFALHPDFNFRYTFKARHVVFFMFIVVLNVLAFKALHGWRSYSTFITLESACIAVLFMSSVHGIKHRMARFSIKLYASSGMHYRYLYAFFIFTWLLLAAIFPTYVIYKKTSAIDDTIWVKTNQLHLARAFLNKSEVIDAKLPHSPEYAAEFDSLFTEHLNTGQYGSAEISIEPMPRTAQDTSAYRSLLWSARPIYDEYIRDFQGLAFTRSADPSWKSLVTADNIEFQLRTSADEGVSVRSNNRSEQGRHVKGSNGLMIKLFSWMGLLGILATMYMLILFYVDRFFGFRYRHLKPNIFDSKYSISFAQVLSDVKANNGLFLIGLPFSGISEFAKQIAREGGFDIRGHISFLDARGYELETDIEELLAELTTLERLNEDIEGDWHDADVFVLENLEHNAKSFEANRLKLRIVSHLISLDKRIILTSEGYPSQILEFYLNQANENGELRIDLLSDHNAWRDILSAFPQVITGMSDNSDAVERKVKTLVGSNPKISRSIADELGYSNFLPSLAEVVFSRNTFKFYDSPKAKLHLDDQRMVMHTQNLSHGYYTDIWNSLPTRERYLLYDLATDGFMNIKNNNSLFSLMKKGLILWRDHPVIFNKSFRNFVVSSVSKSEALTYENNRRVRGSWSTVRVALYLIIFAIIVFIALGEPTLMQDFQSIYGAIAGLGVLVPIFSAMFSGASAKSS